MTTAPAFNPATLGADDLTELLRSVNEVTLQLKQTHVALQQQVARLQGELREANAQLRRSRSLAALGEMAAGIAHEIRNPLASIQLYAQVLRDDLNDRPEQGRVCEKIERSVDRLDAIVTDVLSFARDTKIRAQSVTAQELLDDAVAACEPLLRHTGIDVQTRAKPADLAFEADAGLLGQALTNVLRNGIEAMHDPDAGRREIVVTAHRERRRAADGTRPVRIVLAVDDAGPGVPADVIARMFNPFFTTRATGTGLGLAIVHRIVDAHGGEVRVMNRDEGGARVELCLPPTPGAPVRRESDDESSAVLEIETDEASLNGAVRRRIAVENNR